MVTTRLASHLNPCLRILPLHFSLLRYNTTTAAKPPTLNFRDTQQTYRSKSTMELLRSLAILKSCTYPAFVNNSERLMRVSRTLLGARMFEYVMKRSFYGQFAGGEDIAELQPCVEHLARYGVHSMLNYSVEADVGAPGDEGTCQGNLDTLIQVLESSKEVCSGRPFSSFKITGLTSPQLLFQFTEVLAGLKGVFEKCSTVSVEHGGFTGSLADEIRGNKTLFINRVLTREAFVALTNSQELFDSADTRSCGYLDFYQFRDTMLANPTVLATLGTVPALTEEVISGSERLRVRLAHIVAKTKELDARIMIDAEQTYLQPAIDFFTRELMREHNRDTVYIFNTYQCYLRSTPNTLTQDARDAAQHGYSLGVKLVRGAYMDQERARAGELGCASPIHDTKQGTDSAYHAMLDVVLVLVTRDQGRLLAGSHNEETVRYLMERMALLHITPDKVYFGQLYGLCDPTTFLLSGSGYTVFKAIAWGPVEAVLPFLARRAQENTGVLGGDTRELDLLKTEIWRRIFASRALDG